MNRENIDLDILKLSVGSCTCCSKNPDPKYHSDHCNYRTIKRIEDHIKPAWIDINLPWGGYIIKPVFKARDSFQSRKLNKPGTVVETETGQIFLIGDINELSGVCDDCTEFSADMIIKRYKVIWTKEE